jgi:hypothetical protein
MRNSLLIRLIFLFAISALLFSCKRQVEERDSYDYDPERLTETIPLTVGKYITYRLDSLVFLNFQQNPTIHSYKVKHVVDAQVNDNLGRPSYRIYKYTAAATGPENWQASGTYFITPLDEQVEVTEDNLRVVKIRLPLKEGFEWKGNSYLPTEPYQPFGFTFSNDDDMKNWEFYYDVPEASFTYNGNTYTDVYTVEQQADSSNVPINSPQSYAYKTRSVEKYSKSIGLVYREFALWEYQPNPNGANPYYSGFGVTMWMIDHN